MALPRRVLPPGLLLTLVLAATPASAHLGGASEPGTAHFAMPAWVIWIAGATVVLLSFAVVGAYFTRPDADVGAGTGGEPLLDLDSPGPVSRWTQLAGLVLLLLVLVAGLQPNPTDLPLVLTWLLGWVLLPVVAYTVGNPWPWISPFRALAPLADGLRSGRAPARLPETWGAWPSVVLLLLLTAAELYPGSDQAAVTATLVLVYALFTFVAMVVFGSGTWLARGEALERYLAWWATLSPLRWDAGRPRYVSPATRISRLEVADWSQVAFLLALLYGVNFDGFLSTGIGQAAEGLSNGLVPGFGWLLVLPLGYLVILAAFAACAVLVKRTARSYASLGRIAAAFAASLVPIAVGYHVAHNLPYLYEARIAIPAILANPLGLWGPAVSLDGTLLSLPASWSPTVVALQMLVLLAGHVGAVFTGHRLAEERFPSRVQAIKSEVPLTALMFLYTMVGLWIVSQGALVA